MKILPAVAMLATLCRAADIYFIHDLARVNPQTGGCWEAESLYSTALPPDYRARNAVWDSSGGLVSLKALPDEVAAFQAVVASDSPVSIDGIEVTDLQGPGRIPAGKQVEIFREWFQKVDIPSENSMHHIFSFGKGWYASPLIPMSAPGLKPAFAWPVRLPCPQNRIEGQKAHAFWIDLHVPPEAKAGLYRGKIRVRLEGGMREFTLEARVGGRLMPQQNHSGYHAISQGMRSLLVTQPGLARDVWFLFHAHRLDLEPYSYYLETEGRGRNLKIRWDRHVPNPEQVHLGSANMERDIVPYLRPGAYTKKNGYHGPAQNVAPGWLTLPQQTGWFKRKGIDVDSSADYNETFLASCSLFALKWKEWKLTQRLQMFINKADEPRDKAAFDLAFRHGELAAEARRRYGLDCLFRIDAASVSSWFGRRYSRTWTMDSLYNWFGERVHTWNLNPSFGGCEIESVEKLREREAKGQQFWIYASNTSGQPAIGNNEIDCEAVGTLTWMWVPWKHHVAGAMIWEAFFASFGPARAETLWTSPLPNTEIPNDIGYPNGDVSCLFPWEFISVKPCAVPGIQLKLLRRGSQDFEYLYLLSQLRENRAMADSICASLLGPCLWDLPCDFRKGDGWRKHREGKLVPDDPGFTYMHGKWSHNPEDWVRARHALFEAAEENKQPGKHGNH